MSIIYVRNYCLKMSSEAATYIAVIRSCEMKKQYGMRKDSEQLPNFHSSCKQSLSKLLTNNINKRTTAFRVFIFTIKEITKFQLSKHF